MVDVCSPPLAASAKVLALSVAEGVFIARSSLSSSPTPTPPFDSRHVELVSGADLFWRVEQATFDIVESVHLKKGMSLIERTIGRDYLDMV